MHSKFMRIIRRFCGSKVFVLLAAALTCLSLSCTAEVDEAAAPVGTLAQELSSNEQCDTLSPNASFNKSGVLRTSRSYGHSACFDGFMLNVNKYSARNTDGTRISYGDTAPTTQAACEGTQVRVYLWKRNSDGTTTYLGNKIKNGTWLTDAPSGQARCGLPSVLVDREYPAYVAGGDYRFALRASQATATSYDLRQIFIEAEAGDFDLTAARQMDSLAKILDDIKRSLQGVNGAVSGAFVGPAGVRVLECRLLNLELSAMKIMEPSFVRVGGSAATVTRRSTTLDALYQAYCVRNDPMGMNFQTFVKDHLQALVDLRAEIASGAGITLDESAQLMGSLWNIELGRIRTGCSTSLNEVINYVQTGAVPVGITGPNVLLRNCGGSTGTVRTGLGFGGGPASIGTTLKACIVDAFSGPKEPVEQGCSDPRASGPGPAPAGGDMADTSCSRSVYDGNCLLRTIGANSTEARETLQKVIALENSYSEAEHGVRLAEERAAELTQLALQQARESAESGRDAAAVSIFGKVAEFIGADSLKTAADWVSKVISLGASVERLESISTQLEANRVRTVDIPEAERKREKTRDALCNESSSHFLCPGAPDPTQRCMEWNLASGPVWMDSAVTRRPMTMANRIDSCTCEAIAEFWGSITIGGGTPRELYCQTEQDRTKNACYGTLTTTPNPEECWNQLQPSELDRDSLRTDVCNTVRCANDVTPVVINGVCTCLTTPPTSAELASRCGFSGPAGALDCEAGGLVCDALGARCVNFGTGRSPLAPPGCRAPTGIRLGSRTEWGWLNPSDTFTATFPSRPALAGDDYFMLKKGFIAFTGPEQFPDHFAQVGSTLRVEVLAPDALPTGDRGSIQLYCSNPTNNVTNRFCGQKEFTNLVAGQANTLDFALDASCLTGCARVGTSGYRWGFGFRTPTNQTQLSGFGGLAWAGTLTSRTSPFPVCPTDPDPSSRPNPVTVTQLLGTSAIRPGLLDSTFVRNWTFPLASGTSLGTVPVVIR